MYSISQNLVLSLLLAPNVLAQAGLSKFMTGLAAGSHTRAFSFAFQPDSNDVVRRDGWVQEGPPSQTITAAYMVIENFAEDRPPSIPAIDRIRLAEAFRLADEIGDHVWPNWSKAPFAVLLVTPDYEFLI